VLICVSVRSLVPGFRPALARLREAAARLLAAEGCPAGVVSLVFVGDRVMARLNAAFAGKSRTTDVLSFDLRPAGSARRTGGPGTRAFPALEGVAPTLGEVVVSVDRARAQARERGLPLREEVARLVVHGLLHLAGHDHQRPPERRRMRAREEAWLAAERGGRGWLRPS